MDTTSTLASLPCCPEMVPDDTCDTLDFYYRLNYPVTLAEEGGLRVPVEVKLHFRFKRCPGPMALGNLLYTTTLLPGEKVKLFTSDRRTKFTYDSASQVSYRNTQSSEESFYAQQFSDSVLDTTARDSGKSSSQSHAHVDGHADASADVFDLGGDANMSGNFDANSLSTFLNEHSSHAQASHHAAQMGTRKANSVSIGEVQTRTHTETQSEDHFESASREFANPNKCHAVTFLFYQINKTQTVSYTLEAVERRVILDTDHDFTKVAPNPLAPSTGIGRTSVSLLAADPQARLNTLGTMSSSISLVQGPAAPPSAKTEALTAKRRERALKQVDQELIKEGLLGPDGKAAAEAKDRFSFVTNSSLPTPGVLVKGCLDECSVCEPALKHQIQLDLKRKELENKLLERQIELLDKSQEYRCCPGGDS
jgi:hypothetical protein